MRILGLDISKTSGGFTEYLDGKYYATTHEIKVDKNEDNRFMKCFNNLKDFIQNNYSNRVFDVVIVEDIFFESNVDTFRVLSVLNLCVDYCVSEGIIQTKEYLKISNKTWKSWLFNGDSYKGMSDKERIRRNVLDNDISYDGLKGYQDMYDSTGMIMGYFIKDNNKQNQNGVVQKHNLKLKDLNCLYFLFKEELQQQLNQLGINNEDIKYFKVPRMSEKALLEMIYKDENLVYVSESKVNLGNMGEVLKVPPLVGGGYCAIWKKSTFK